MRDQIAVKLGNVSNPECEDFGNVLSDRIDFENPDIFGNPLVAVVIENQLFWSSEVNSHADLLEKINNTYRVSFGTESYMQLEARWMEDANGLPYFALSLVAFNGYNFELFKSYSELIVQDVVNLINDDNTTVVVNLTIFTTDEDYEHKRLKFSSSQNPKSIMTEFSPFLAES